MGSLRGTGGNGQRDPPKKTTKVSCFSNFWQGHPLIKLISHIDKQIMYSGVDFICSGHFSSTADFQTDKIKIVKFKRKKTLRESDSFCLDGGGFKMVRLLRILN